MYSDVVSHSFLYVVYDGAREKIIFKNSFCFSLLAKRGVHAHVISDIVYSYQLIIDNNQLIIIN